jgi:hypothetical protein
MANVSDEQLADIWDSQVRKAGHVWTVCNTNGCENATTPILATVDFNPPIVYCGACGIMIEDVSPFVAT